jgi:aminopeptidase YwaD
MFKYSLLVTFFYISFNIYSQDLNNVKRNIEQLAGPSYYGRGYVKKGDSKAAQYIASEFKKAGLLPANKSSYYQKLSFPVNTFPNELLVKCNGVVLKPGVDYIVEPDCPAFSYKGLVTFVSHSQLNNERYYDSVGYKQSYAVLDTFTPKYSETAEITKRKFLKNYKQPLIIELSQTKLTWSASYKQGNRCHITLLNSAFKRDSVLYFEINIKPKFIPKYNSSNVLGMIKGSSNKDTFIVFTAHYDHLGMMGKTATFNGANDNASGVAMMLELAKHYSQNKPYYNLLFIAFTGEELGLIGSNYYVRNPVFPLANIKFLINIDLMGNGSEGVMVVNGSLHGKEFNLLSAINKQYNYLPQVKSRGKAANSDHYWFSEAGVKAFFFYLMGPYPHYHDVNDRPEMLPYANFENAFLLFRDFIDRIR